MASLRRHQCLIYAGSPIQYLPAVTAAICRKLKENQRCLYLNSIPMVAGLRSYLAATGLDVAQHEQKGSLILSSDQDHLVNGHFAIEHMMQTLQNALEEARGDGYAGMWATGDMSWEFGPDRDFSKLVEYEWQLEEFFRSNPDFGGVCQYHADTLPWQCLHHGVATHPAIFVNDTLSRINPDYVPRIKFQPDRLQSHRLELALANLLRPEDVN